MPVAAPAAMSRPGPYQAGRPTPPAPSRAESAPAGDGASFPRDVLVVASKLKVYVRATSGMNTSDDVMEALSIRLRNLCDDAVERARADGRKTVMARDFRRPTQGT